MLPLALRNQLLGQPRSLPPAVPPQIHRHGQGDGRAAGHRRTLRPVAQRPMHHRLPRQNDRRGGPGAEDRGTRPRRGVRETRGGVLRPGAQGDGVRDLHSRFNCGAERAAPHGFQPRFLGRLLRRTPRRGAQPRLRIVGHPTQSVCGKGDELLPKALGSRGVGRSGSARCRGNRSSFSARPRASPNRRSPNCTDPTDSRQSRSPRGNSAPSARPASSAAATSSTNSSPPKQPENQYR